MTRVPERAISVFEHLFLKIISSLFLTGTLIPRGAPYPKSWPFASARQLSTYALTTSKTCRSYLDSPWLCPSLSLSTFNCDTFQKDGDDLRLDTLAPKMSFRTLSTL